MAAILHSVKMHESHFVSEGISSKSRQLNNKLLIECTKLLNYGQCHRHCGFLYYVWTMCTYTCVYICVIHTWKMSDNDIC